MASEKVTAIVEELKTLTVLELSELVSAVEEEFGVSAAAAVAVAAAAERAAGDFMPRRTQRAWPMCQATATSPNCTRARWYLRGCRQRHTAQNGLLACEPSGRRAKPLQTMPGLAISSSRWAARVARTGARLPPSCGGNCV